MGGLLRSKYRQLSSYARMMLLVHDTNSIFVFFIEMKMAKRIFVVKRYTVCSANVKPYEVRKLKIKQYAIHKREGDFTLILTVWFIS